MKFSTRQRLPLRLRALAMLSVGLLFPAGAAQATTAGSVVAWGCGGGANYGQCAVPAAATSGVTAIAAGDFHSLALKEDGSVVAWGCGADFGQCTVPVAAASGVTAIAAGYAHSLALKQDGSVVAWGCDGFDVGQCTVPAAATSGVTAIAASFSHSLALKQDGSVIAWGCGDNYDGGQCNVPPEAESGVTAIAAGFSHSLALKQDGSVITWGCGFNVGECTVPPEAESGVTAIAASTYHSLALVGSTNRPPSCSGVTATPDSIFPRMRDQMALITLSGATDPDGDTLGYHIDGVTQDEYVTGVGDDTFPDAALTSAGASSNQVLVRSEANSHFNGRVYRIAYTVSDGKGGSCSGTAGPSGNTTAKVGVQRKKGIPAIDDGNAMSWNSLTGAPVP
jgi:Regulator of chromosome condensation (RCC1) repeat